MLSNRRSNFAFHRGKFNWGELRLLFQPIKVIQQQEFGQLLIGVISRWASGFRCAMNAPVKRFSLPVFSPSSMSFQQSCAVSPEIAFEKSFAPCSFSSVRLRMISSSRLYPVRILSSGLCQKLSARSAMRLSMIP
jgi:hypothetical protein